MVNISSNELNELTKMGSGNFGTIYKSDDKVLKIYNEYIKTDTHENIKNPMLRYKLISINRLNKLINLKDKIKNTDLIEDLLYIDNKFNGVIMPYYEGKLFLELINKPIDEKIELCKKLVTNAKELTDNKIYPLDYKLINVFYTNNNEVKLIDLDDIFTKVYNLNNIYYKKESITILDETIKTFLKEYNYYSQKINKILNNKTYGINSSYETINHYLYLKSIKNNLLFIDENHNYGNIPGFKTIYTYKTYDEEYIIKSINNLKEKGITINDIVKYDLINEYINNNSNEICLKSENKRILKIK